MNRFNSAVVFAAALLGAATSALGGVAGTITTVATPLSASPNPADLPNATYSDPARGLQSIVGYKVDIANGGRNTSNAVRFTAVAEVTDHPAELAVFDSAEGATCTTTNPASTAIACAIGTLRAGQVVPTFYVFFKTPAKVINGIADEAGQDSVRLSYQTFYAEGGRGHKSKPKNGFTPLTDAVPVVLGTPDPTLVRSIVLARGGTFFTGNIGEADTGDQHATKTVVPALTTHTTVQILEIPELGTVTAPCTANVFTCYTSQINIPGNFNAPPYLTIRLSQAIENIQFLPCKKKRYGHHGHHGHDDHDDHGGYAKSSTSSCTPTTRVPIEQVSIFYVPDLPADQTPLPVGLCVLPEPFMPPLDRPCISTRTVVKVPPVTGPTVRYEWIFISFKNGTLRIR